MQLTEEEIKSKDCCNNCSHYVPFIKKGRQTMRGHCDIQKSSYKQRTETCKRFDRK